MHVRGKKYPFKSDGYSYRDNTEIPSINIWIEFCPSQAGVDFGLFRAPRPCKAGQNPLSRIKTDARRWAASQARLRRSLSILTRPRVSRSPGKA